MSRAIKWAHLEVLHESLCVLMPQLREEDSGEQKNNNSALIFIQTDSFGI